MGLSMISLAIESRSWSPSKARFDSNVLERFREMVE